MIEKQSEVIMNLNSSLKDLEERVIKMNDERVRNRDVFISFMFVHVDYFFCVLHVILLHSVFCRSAGWYKNLTCQLSL